MLDTNVVHSFPVPKTAIA